MDRFREEQQKQCGIGGLKCSCCNPFLKNSKSNNKDKYKLNKIARKRLKNELYWQLNEAA